MNDPTLSRTVCQIATYWLARPQACDTRIGVRSWWLRSPVHVLQVQQALDALVREGIACPGSEPEARADDGATYRLAVSRDELRAWLSARFGAPPAEPHSPWPIP